MGFGKDGRGEIIYDAFQVSIATLNGKTAIAGLGASDDALTEKFRLVKTEGWLAVEGTAVSTALLIGIAASEFTQAEIEAAMETAHLSPQATSGEASERPVFLLGAVDCQNRSSQVVHWEKTIRWTFHAGFQFFIYNISSSNATTGNLAVMQSKNFGVWVQ